MLRQEFLEQLSRLGAICPRAQRFMSGDEEKVYTVELERRFLNISKLMWSEMVTWVIDHHKTKQLPNSHEFNDAMQAVYKNSPAHGTMFGKCSSCKGDGIVFGQVKMLSDDALYSACRPCSECRPETKNWKLKDGIVEVTTCAS